MIAVALLGIRADCAGADHDRQHRRHRVRADGEALPGVTVEAIHVPTGTRYDTVSGANGRYHDPERPRRRTVRGLGQRWKASARSRRRTSASPSARPPKCR